MTPRRSLAAARQARHRDVVAAILPAMWEAIAPLQGIARTRNLSAAFEASHRGFTTARLVIAPDAADDVSLVTRVRSCTLVTSISVAIDANGMVHLGSAHRVTGAGGEDFYLWHTEREAPVAAAPFTRDVAELRDQLFATFPEAARQLVDRANAGD